MKIKIDLSWTVIVIGIIVGTLSGGLIGGVRGFAYALTTSVVASILSLIPIAGPLILWFWIMPLFKSAIGVGGEMFIVDILIIVFSIFINIIIAIIVISFIMYLFS
ncbi:MAG: hypothetical protein ACP5GU_09860 [Thermoprotei archaeon]